MYKSNANRIMAFFNFKSKEATKNSQKLYAGNRSFQSTGTRRADGRYVAAEELYDYIADYFSEALEASGFKYLKSKKTFRRITETGCDEIQMRFIDHAHYHVDFHFNKRIDRLQKVITAIEYENGFNSIANYKEHYTIGVTYGNLNGRNIEVVSYAVLDKELPKVLALIEHTIIPYFDKLNDVGFVNRTLNYPREDADNPFSYFATNGFDSAVITGLIVAKLLDDPNYQDLLDVYLAKHPQNIVLKEQLVKLNEYWGFPPPATKSKNN